MNKRKPIPAKLRNDVLKRDRYKCVNCGKSPANDPEVELEADHIVPVANGGLNELDNLQTLCRSCNRGKGKDEQYNISLREKTENYLDTINPNIRSALSTEAKVRIVANQEEFVELTRLNKLCSSYLLVPSTNSIHGYRAAFGHGIYTLNDNYGAKVMFVISRKE